ncbi:CobW family GTP-binding protein [Herbaspirillum sp. alder98]|uniref:CobW family GTP-binding protein n=1 Tax=Herbaspirillum sp. alder98 TaxID=2913096 RepID=UPI001CD8A502|nr:GTP-binding protein [Herbaspirillum sp. alder98]MCA1324732.1 GTP-binding protein [Herbaspirillum sp. alder98]
MNELIPVTLLTGFLGSGKTTILNQLVGHDCMRRSLVIINEFGDIALDHLLVSHSEEELVIEMDSGCVCCTVRQDLASTMKEVLWRFSRDGERQFDRVVIETTGLADPTPILHTLITSRTLANHYKLDGIVTVVDAAAGNITLDNHQEAIKQAAFADKLLVTKADLASTDELDTLSARLKRLNPSARQVQVASGAIDPSEILGLGLFDAASKSPDANRWLSQEAYTVVAATRPGGSNPLAAMGRPVPGPTRHDDRIRSFCYVVEAPMAPDTFDIWLSSIMELMGQKMLRVKGIVNVKGASAPYVIHGVQHIFHPPFMLDQWPSDDHRTRIVFITQDVGPKIIDDVFQQADLMNGATAVAPPVHRTAP